MQMKKVAIGQAGGPTAVINTSLVGALDAIGDKMQIYGIRNGYNGLVENEIEPLEGHLLQWVQKNKYVPGACLGSGRYMFTKDKISKAVQNLRKHDIHCLLFIGGNGTMAALEQVSIEAKAIGYDLQVIGIPKTVDNDLGETDHAPGFGSAARYVALAARDISKDLEAMKNFEKVRIIETMGRNAGWLAAASGILKNNEEDGPHLIYLPEVPFEQEKFLLDIQETVNAFGMATVVVSEGVAKEGCSQVEKRHVMGRTILGGISYELENLVQQELGFNARAENLGMNQRSSYAAVSDQDRLEAYAVGQKAGKLALEERTKVMVSINRTNSKDYSFYLSACPIEQVAKGGERLLSSEFIANRELYYNWLRPLIGSDIAPYPSALGKFSLNQTAD